jgi:hypothetical protein
MIGETIYYLIGKIMYYSILVGLIVLAVVIVYFYFKKD